MYTFLAIVAVVLFFAFTQAGGFIAAFFIELVVGIFDREGGRATAGRYLRSQQALRDKALRFLRRK